MGGTTVVLELEPAYRARVLKKTNSRSAGGILQNGGKAAAVGV